MTKKRIFVLSLVLWTLSIGMTIPGTAGAQQSGGWEPFQELKREPKTSEATRPGQKQAVGQLLTNDSVVKLVRAGIAENTILTMMDTQPGNYSVGPDDVIALKAAGVPDKIISAMLKSPASEPRPEPSTSEEFQRAVIAISATDIGVYYRKHDAWVQAMPEMVNWKTGGVVKTVATAAIVKPDVNGHLHGGTSPLSLATPAEFLFHLSEGVEITEYQLVRLRAHENSREFRTVTGGVFHASGGATRDLVAFQYKKVGGRTYSVTLSDLNPGEYGFLAPGGALSSNASAHLGKIYTFRLLE